MLQLDVEVAVERKEGVEYFVETEVDLVRNSERVAITNISHMG
jgi:hypothetical protein